MADYEKTQSDLDRLQRQYDQSIQAWRRAGQGRLPSLQSPLVGSDALSGELPSECVAHLQEEKAKLERDGYSNEAWMQHVFKCDMCCAPLLASILEHHVAHVVANPHRVILFDFNMYDLHETYERQLDDLMGQFDPAHDQLLLIGRASRVGDRAYNIILSGNRAGAIKDYVRRNHAIDESRIHYLYFGFDPPQLTPAIAKRYGVTADDLAAIDPYLNNSPENKINQSVVVVINKNADVEQSVPASKQVADAPQHAEPVQSEPMSETVQSADSSEPAPPKLPEVTAEPQPQPAEPAPAPKAAEVDPTGPQDSTPRPQSQGEFSDLKRGDQGSNEQSEDLVIVAGALASTSFTFAQDITRAAHTAGLDVSVQQSDAGGLDTVQHLVQLNRPAMGMLPADILPFLSHASDPNLNRTAKQLRLILPFYDEDVHLFARKDIQSVNDLNGKRVVAGMRGSDNWVTAHNLIHIFDLQPADVIDDLPPIEAIVAVLTGTADAMIYVEDKPASSFVNLRVFQSNPQLAPLVQDVHFVPLQPPSDLPGYTVSAIGPDDYSWVEATIPTLAVKMLLTGLEDPTDPPQDESFCKKMATLGRAVQNSLADLQRTGHPKWRDVDLDQQLTSWKRDSCIQAATRGHDQNGTSISKRQ